MKRLLGEEREKPMRHLFAAIGACLLLTGPCVSSAYAGDGDIGACCVWWMGDCFEMTEIECQNEEGNFLGVGVSCEDVTCSFTCCLGNGECVPVLDKARVLHDWGNPSRRRLLLHEL